MQNFRETSLAWRYCPRPVLGVARKVLCAPGERFEGHFGVVFDTSRAQVGPQHGFQIV